MSELNYVELKCVKQGSKLRVKIISQGYINNANCQFPKDLRIEGRRFKVQSEYIKLITQKGRWFYSIKKKNSIEIIDNISSEELSKIQIYEDKDEDECSTRSARSRTFLKKSADFFKKLFYLYE